MLWLFSLVAEYSAKQTLTRVSRDFSAFALASSHKTTTTRWIYSYRHSDRKSVHLSAYCVEKNCADFRWTQIEFILEVIYFIFSRYYLKTHIPAETVWSFHEDPCTTQDLKLLPTMRNGGVDAEKVYKNSRSQEIKKAVFSKSDVTMEKSTTLQKVRQSPVCRTPCSWTPVDTRPTSTEQNICSQ